MYLAKRGSDEITSSYLVKVKMYRRVEQITIVICISDYISDILAMQCTVSHSLQNER